MEQPSGHQTRAYLCPDAAYASLDLLDLTGRDVLAINHDAASPAASTVTYRDQQRLSFAQIARIIPCFTAGTLIATPQGERPAQDLRAGDRVLTRDNGLQTITWAGQKTMTMQGLPLTDDMCPIKIRKGAFGANCPERDMVVSPNHRILMAGADRSEVLVAAKNLTHLPGVAPLQVPQVTYIHFMCAHHEIVFSDGAWTETFQPNDESLHGIDAAQRQELLAIFPELARHDGLRAYGTARATAASGTFIAA